MFTKLLRNNDIRQWDHYTIHEMGVPSILLMEQAAQAFLQVFSRTYTPPQLIYIFAGMGNNGGDGLAIARLLYLQGYNTKVFILRTKAQGTPDFETNRYRWQQIAPIHWIEAEKDFPDIPSHALVIDALFGTGLSRKPEGIAARLIMHLNQQATRIVSVDLPSGLLESQPPHPATVVRAQHTITFQHPKLSFVLEEFAPYIGEWTVVDIGLSPQFIQFVESPYFLITQEAVRQIYRPRTRFSHKGTYGHALLWAGSQGKIGAALLAARACLRTGVGLLSVQLPACGYIPLQSSLPEAMVIQDPHEQHLSHTPKLDNFQAIGIGPGIAQHAETAQALEALLAASQLPTVVDADALNLIAKHEHMRQYLGKHCILTPHPKEFERLIGRDWQNDYQLIELLGQFSQQYQCFVVLKRAYSIISTPQGNFYFNTHGHAGMAVGGSGDALTGILTALLAQGYLPEQAAILGVYLHARAAELALVEQSMESMLPSDLIEHIGKAYHSLYQ